MNGDLTIALHRGPVGQWMCRDAASGMKYACTYISMAIGSDHFGHGNTPGDTVVFVPEARVAWTGNLILGEGTIPFLIEGGAGAYLETMAKFAHTLEVRTIVPGHGLLTSGAILGRYLPYLSELIESVQKAIRAGQNLEDTIATTPLGQQYTQDIAGSDPPLVAQFAAFRAGVHRWNVWRTYQGMNADAARSRAGALTRFAPASPAPGQREPTHQRLVQLGR